ncbi:hypothetical protein Ahy_B08g093317 [Arachis hypogaea]|uniref:Uncharacterized protein n=1 Tax=Arachis hypogaea TaxID=3818 RepID=A0A444Y5U3_ARAHY|nr:hypothetical protein Ahy_B08g093317 [Arachis hypogaea]
MVHSSSSPSKKTQTVKFRGTFQTEETFELVTKISRNHQQKIELSINNLQKKQRNIIQDGNKLSSGQTGGESFEKFETPARTNENTTYENRLTNEYDTVYTLKSQDSYILSKIHLASLAAETHIEAENMAIANHSEGVFLQPKTNKPSRVEDYPMFIPFLDLKKLASHRYYMLGAPLKRRDKDKEIEPPYINISGQKTSYDCAIYIMK